MPSGVLFAFCAYALYSCSDATIKGLGGSMSVTELAFFSTLFALLPAILTTPPGERWHHFLRLRHPLLVHLRGVSGAIGNLCIIYAFVKVPLAEAYSLAFLAPIMVVFISVFMLRESVGWQRWLFLATSFVGVLIVVRPGFRELHLGHLAAVVAAICGAITTTAMRRVANDEKRVSLIGVASAYILVMNGILMLPDFHWPSVHDTLMLVLIGAFGGTANLLFIAATRRSPASQVAPVQYSQIAWAIIFGSLFYKEFPDATAYVGLAVVIVAGILNVLSGGSIRIFSRLSPAASGPVTAIATTPPLSDGVLETPTPGAIEATTPRSGAA